MNMKIVVPFLKIEDKIDVSCLIKLFPRSTHLRFCHTDWRFKFDVYAKCGLHSC